MSEPSVLFVSHTHRGGSFVVGSHHLSRELATLGWRVGHLSTPYSLLHQVQGRGSAGRSASATRGVELTEGVVDLVPKTVLPAALVRRSEMRSTLETMGFASPDFVLIDQPSLYRRRLFGGTTTIVYRPTDIEVSLGARARAKVLVRDADAFLVTNEEVARSLGSLGTRPIRLMENGAQTGRFLACDVSSPRPRKVVYVGALDERFDIASVTRIARALSNVDFELYGPVEVSLGPLPANVRTMGPVPYGELPLVLGTASVGLLPLNSNPRNAGRSPMKLYEYLAAGLHVVATRTPVTAAHEEHVSLYADDEEAIEQIARALDQSSPNVTGRSVALMNDWAEKARDVARWLIEEVQG